MLAWHESPFLLSKNITLYPHGGTIMHKLAIILAIVGMALITYPFGTSVLIFWVGLKAFLSVKV